MQIKEQIIKIARKIYDRKLSSALSGNISCKIKDKIYITTSGSCLGELEQNQVIQIDFKGIPSPNENEQVLKPSSEWMMHAEIYKKNPKINAIIHAHPPFSTAVASSCNGEFIPIVAETVVILGEVKIADYKIPSSLELAKETANCFDTCNAVFMSNHGSVVIGENLSEAFYRLETLEFYSQIYILTGLLGDRKVLSEQQVKDLGKLIYQ